MPRTQSITHVSFDGDGLGRVLSVRFARSADADSGRGNGRTALPPERPTLTIEVRTRDVQQAEALALGRRGDLVFTVGPTEAGQEDRQVTLADAMFVVLDVQYEQAAPAVAVLRFEAECDWPPGEGGEILPEPVESTVDEEELFASGPSGLLVGSWTRRLLRRELPGLDGEVVVDLGLRGRPLTQIGRLSAHSPLAFHSMLESIARFQDGRPHSLLDRHNTFYRNVLMLSFELTTPVTAGPDGLWADYRIEYLQLP